ncbi:MAG: SDR family oxidoreductase [Euryhalocaulis sp.]|uniref:SDR family NAD(P)-dependent oxidoreductase n=1 Tax=Euryhalocaulis sp. TaxID=2744307 RepID=UPI0017B93312|nr:SDR family oxidoreductase [Euryhalocaulis sp.]MBA4800847.1 SDR family oxidoreductase [Euryhalocaulis sp.]
MTDLKNKTILVTGASKGIGRAIVERLGQSGAYVIAHYGSDRAGAEEATSDIPDERKLLVSADLNDLDSVEALWDEAERWRGKVDIFVNNAATMMWNGGFDAPLEDWDKVWRDTLNINVLGPVRLLRRAVRHYRETGGGVIITLSSWAAQRGVGNPDTIAYGASKAAVAAATQSIARAYAKENILAYIIAPGVVRTRLSEDFARSQGGEEKVTQSLAMGEWVSPAELANLVNFLSTGEVRQLSGATLDVNGASYIR